MFRECGMVVTELASAAEGEAEVFGEFLVTDAVEGGEGSDAGGEGGRGIARAAGGWRGLDCGEHQVLGGVLGRNKLEDFGAIAGPFEEHGA